MRELFRDAAKYLPSQVIPAIVGFVSIPLLTNMFSPEEFGDYRLVLATIGIVAPVVSWVSYPIYRFFPEYERDLKLGSFYATSVKLSLLTQFSLTALLAVLLVLVRERFSDWLFYSMAIGLALLLVRTLFSTLSAFVRSRREPGWFSISVIVQSVLSLVIGVLLIFVFSSGISGFLWGMVIGGATIIPLMWWRAQRGILIPWRERIDRDLASAMFRYSYPIVLGLSAIWLLRLSDRFILEYFHGSGAVGIYAASYGLADASIGLVVIVFHLPFSVLSNRVFENEGEAAATRFVSDSARWFLLAVIPSVVGLSVLAEPLVDLMAGDEFLEGYRVVPFVATATLLGGLVAWYTSAFKFRKRTLFQPIAIGSGAVVNIGLNFLFIPQFGYMAAGVTTLVGFLTVNIVSYFLGRRMFYWRLPVGSVLRSLVASAVMALAVIAANRVVVMPPAGALVASVVVGALVYAASLFLLQEFTPAELRTVRRYVRRS